MSARLFIGNLSYNATEEDLRSAFNDCGFMVKKATIVTDRDTGQARGFGFIELDDAGRAKDALTVMDGTVIAGRPIRVNEAHEKERRGPSGGGGAPQTSERRPQRGRREERDRDRW